jgi:hypothetical protein
MRDCYEDDRNVSDDEMTLQESHKPGQVAVLNYAKQTRAEMSLA